MGIEKNKCKKLNDDYTCVNGYPQLHGEIVTPYGTFIYEYDRYIGRKND
jgi:hypothetical protein